MPGTVDNFRAIEEQQCSGWKYMLRSASRSPGKRENTEQKLLARKRTYRRFISKPKIILEAHFRNLGISVMIGFSHM